MMSDFTVNVTSAGSANVVVSNGSTVNATVGNGGAVNVAIGGVSPGNATVVSGTLTINSTETLAAGSAAFVKNVGSVYAAKLDIGIPAGPATSILIGNTTTLTPGSNATVTGTANGSNLTLAFGIPSGANGVTPVLSINSVTTGAPGSSANVSATTNGANVLLDFTIPRGDPGTNGTSGSNLTLSDATPANLGTAAAGSSSLAARADHVHTLPTAAAIGAASANHAHNYVTGLNNLTGNLTLAAGSNITLTANGSTLTLAASGGLGANDAIDGGDYAGEIVASITFLSQPQSVTVNLGQSLTWASGTNTSRYLLQSGNAALGLQLTSNGQTANIATYSNLSAAADSTATVSNLTLSSEAASVSLASNGTRSLIQIWQDTGSVTTETLRSDDGVSWSRLTVPRPSRFIAAGPLGFVADAYSDAGVALTSADGVAWNTRAMPFSSTAGGYSTWRFAVGPTAMVGVCDDAQRVARSSNGVSWSSVNLTTGSNVAYTTNIAYGGGKFVALGSRGTVSGSLLVRGDAAFSSADGSTWTRSNLPTSGYQKISYLNGRFIALRGGVATNESTTDAAVSTDGVNWTLQTLPAAKLWQTAAYAGGYYAVSEYNGLSAFSALAVASEPTAGSANLTVSAVASTGATVGYQWQRSLDGGTTFANVANATTAALNLTGVTLADSGTRYRVLATATGVPSATSSTALLTVQ